MLKILSENLPICLVIVFSVLVMCGVREWITTPIPGDRERQALLSTMRKISARSQQQKQALLAKIAGLTEEDCWSEYCGKGKEQVDWRLGDQRRLLLHLRPPIKRKS